MTECRGTAILTGATALAILASVALVAAEGPPKDPNATKAADLVELVTLDPTTGACVGAMTAHAPCSRVARRAARYHQEQARSGTGPPMRPKRNENSVER